MNHLLLSTVLVYSFSLSCHPHTPFVFLACTKRTMIVASHETMELSDCVIQICPMNTVCAPYVDSYLVTQHPRYLPVTSQLISAEVTELATSSHPSHCTCFTRCVGGKSVWLYRFYKCLHAGFKSWQWWAANRHFHSKYIQSIQQLWQRRCMRKEWCYRK